MGVVGTPIERKPRLLEYLKHRIYMLGNGKKQANVKNQLRYALILGRDLQLHFFGFNICQRYDADEITATGKNRVGFDTG